MTKRRLFLASLLLAVATALAVAPAFAAERRTLTVSDRIFLQGTEIPAGHYSLRWEATRAPDEFSLTVQAGKKVLATTTGRKVKLDEPSIYDSLIYKPGEAGSQTLVEIRFAGKTEAIRIEPPTEASLR